MIKSMTGYGTALHDDGRTQVSVELKSLNSKFLDLNLRLPKQFADREIEIRNVISEKLERGKVSVVIDFQRYGEAEIKQTYNEKLFASYYLELKKLANSVNATTDQLFQLALNAPDVIQSKMKEENNDADWELVKQVMEAAIQKCEQFRAAEGRALDTMLRNCITEIGAQLKQVEQLDPKRVEKIRDRLRGNVVAFFGEEGFDPNRLEQEIIFYIEKLDINEEKVRLSTHLNYFQKVMEEKQAGGKKLGFIAQEIGREINTIGSKANDAGIQKHVVVMKEELEKIKEQLNNVL